MDTLGMGFVMATSALEIAAFDFDHTLTKRSTLVRFLARLVGARRLAIAVARGIASAGAPPSRLRFKTAMVGHAVAGLRSEVVQRTARTFAGSLLDNGLQEQVVARAELHRRCGHRVVIVTSALAAYVEPVARALGIDDVIATHLVVDADGRCTGELVDADLWGDKKVDRLLALLGVPADSSGLCLWAYGDSEDDEALRELARRSGHGSNTGVYGRGGTGTSPSPTDPHLKES
jgi:phosphatidylglycerophosphatase C